MSDNAIELTAVAKSFGSNRVLDRVDLCVPMGHTFAFLGRNGAGKTTTIRMLLGLLRPDHGSVRILGLDPAVQPLAVRSLVGYLAEDQASYGWMTVAEMIGFIGSFYPTWDNDYAAKLARQFELPLQTRCRHLSKGQSVHLGLLLALAHRPKLVILDDPTLGLDPIARKRFLSDVVTLLQGEGVTVFFSSHLLYEVEPIADQVAILDHGRIVLSCESEELRHRVKKLLMSVEEYNRLKPIAGLLDLEPVDRRVAVTVSEYPAVQTSLAAQGIEPQVVDLNLDEIFQAYVAGRGREKGAGALA